MILLFTYNSFLYHRAEDMKPRCVYVCAATCDQNAVAEVIERFVLA